MHALKDEKQSLVQLVAGLGQPQKVEDQMLICHPCMLRPQFKYSVSVVGQAHK